MKNKRPKFIDIGNLRIIVVLMIVSSLLVGTRLAHAVMVDDLYVAKVFVDSQDQSQLQLGARAGLLQVLVRVSGVNLVQENAVIKNALKNPAPYYYQYSYQSSDRTFQVGNEEFATRILKLRFEPSAVAQLLRNAGLPVWGSKRPSILMWVAESDANSRRILGEGDRSDIVVAFNELSKLRGLPLLYPLLDLEDDLSTAEVWGTFLERIKLASARYVPDVILTGRIQQNTAGQWDGKWSYYFNNRWYHYNNSAFSPSELSIGIFDLLADQLAKHYAVDSSKSVVRLKVENIVSLEDFAGVSQYLTSLAPVLSSFVVEVNESDVFFRLQTEGRVEQLIEIIALDEKMVLMNQKRDESEPSLFYRWLY